MHNVHMNKNKCEARLSLMEARLWEEGSSRVCVCLRV